MRAFITVFMAAARLEMSRETSDGEDAGIVA